MYVDPSGFNVQTTFLAPNPVPSKQTDGPRSDSADSDSDSDSEEEMIEIEVDVGDGGMSSGDAEAELLRPFLDHLHRHQHSCIPPSLIQPLLSQLNSPDEET